MNAGSDMSENETISATAEASYRKYLDALLKGDRLRCREIFESWLKAGVDLSVVYQNLVQRSLYDVGSLWEQGKVSVATEHLATAITESLLNLVYPRLFARPRNGRVAVVSSLANEYHQIGGKIVADMFELHGWRSHYLGANTPSGDLLELVRTRKPDVVALSLTVYFGFDTLYQAVRELRNSFPEIPILVGGQAFRWGGQERIEQIQGVRYLSSLDTLAAWMKAT